MRRLACVLVLALACGGCTFTETVFYYAKGLPCEVLNDEAKWGAVKERVHAGVEVALEAGKAVANEALQCPTK